MSATLVLLQTITTNDPVFDGVADDVLEAWIALAVVEVSTTKWGALYDQAVAYLAAHKYVMGPGLAGDGLSAGGPVAERRARNWAIRFQAVSGSGKGDASLSETSYGREFLRLRSLTRSPLLVTPST